MRKKTNLLPRMDRCEALLERSPEEHRGRWLKDFPGKKALHLELGCGKGRFTADTAAAAPDVLLCAVERVPDAMVIALERARERGLDNVRFMQWDAAALERCFAPGEAERIYVNFCDPWLPKRQHKRRLTAPGFLEIYARLLKAGGEVHFKTDNTELFDWSLESFRSCGWTLSEVTDDLHAEGQTGVVTDYEAKFIADGVKIHRCVARRPDVVPEKPGTKSYLVHADGSVTALETLVRREGDKTILTLPARCVTPDTQYVDFCPDWAAAAPQDGYCFFPRGTKEGGTILCSFRERENTFYLNDSNLLPLWGWKDERQSFLAVVTGMAWDYRMAAEVRENVFRAWPRFYVDDRTTYEPLQVTIYSLPLGSGYNEMARLYREMKLAAGCVPLRERAKARPELAYAVEAPEIRVRMAWKPVPTPVEEQTEENEPPVRTAVTCEELIAFMDALHAAGVKKAEICLVGIEKSGHDGRWPQLFPIEPSIGGEEGLKKAVAHGQALGYQITAHTNNTEMYSISADWDPDKLILQADGSVLKDHNLWGGGRPYMICPSETVAFARRDLPKLAGLGFRGIHYIDVLSIFPPRKCYDPRHPMNRAQSIEKIREIMRLSRETFGGFASEGAFDFAIEDLDYVLYCGYNELGTQPAIADRTIPFWQLVYHGIVLYNPCTETVNWCVKDETNHLKYVEYGGRPLAYLYSKYVTENPDLPNWMGQEDLTASTPEELAACVEKIRRMAEEYELLAPLQYCFMERHEELRPGVFETEYSDGTVVTVDYGEKTRRISRK